jgi:glycosyltransferase involved in cell wall biosynthesis
MELYATLRPGTEQFAGGAGFQLASLCRELVSRGHEVSAVVGDFGQPEAREEIEGIDVLRSNRVGYDRSLMRGLDNVGRLWRAMHRARCDVWVLRSTRFLLPQVHAFARLLRSKSVFMVANMDNCRPEKSEGCPKPVQRLYNRWLPRLDAVTVQTRAQQKLLAENWGIEGHLVPNGIVMEAESGDEAEPSWDVLWIGRLMRVKGPERLIALAKACPGLRFAVAGGPAPDTAYSDRVTADLSALPNIEFLGFVPPDRARELYGQAKLLLNTSENEGFSNTFLQAWKHRRPVCTTGVDPDGVIAGKDLGIVEPDMDRLAERLTGLIEDTERLRGLGERCRDHVGEEHDIRVTCDRFLEVLNGI